MKQLSRHSWIPFLSSFFKALYQINDYPHHHYPRQADKQIEKKGICQRRGEGNRGRYWFLVADLNQNSAHTFFK